MHGPGPRQLRLARGWCCAGVLLSVLRLGGGELNCLVEERVCYQGTNIAVDFTGFGSIHQGCREVQNPQECCQLCASYWPQCVSWQFIREGTVANGYNGMNSFCCLKGELAPDPLTADYCDSGYQNPRCFLTEACAVEVTGAGLAATDSIVAIQPGETCGDPGVSAASWAGIANPQTASAAGATTADFTLGTAPSGAAGVYPLCYGAAGASVQDHASTVGVFTMRGPDAGQSLTCTLGQQCLPTLAGTGFPVIGAGAQYKVAVVEDPGGGDPCGTGAVLAGIDGIQNPDNVEDNDFDDTFNMEKPTAGSTLASYAMCWANNPTDDLADYVFHVGSFTLNGPEVGAPTCVLGRACSFEMEGTGLSTSMGLLLVAGADEFLCQALAEGDVAGFGSGLANPSLAFSATSGVGGTMNFSLGVPSEAHTNTPGSGYRLCYSASPSQQPPAYALADYSVDVGTFTLHGPVFEDTSCVLTRPCQLAFSGSGLGLLSWGLLVIEQGEQCGVASAGANISGGSWANPGSGAGDGTVAFGTATIGPGSYSACWGSYPSSLSDYNVAVGAFSMHGPSDEMPDFVCIKGLECTMILECPPGLSSCGLEATNRLLLLDPGSTCGSSSPSQASFSPMVTDRNVNNDGVFFRYELGYPDVGTAQDRYEICWGADPASLAEYSFSLGLLSVTGANFKDMSCTLGLPCQLQVIGFSLASTNRVIVLGSGDCGKGENDVTFAALSGLSTSQQVESSAPYDSYDLSVPVAGVPGAGYKVCWASAPGEAGGTNLYRVQAGALTIDGPDQVAHTCTLGVECTIGLTGNGLSTSNKVLIIHSSSSCGDVAPEVAVFDGVQNPQIARTSDASQFDMGTAGTTSGGVGGDYSLCWAHDPSSLEDYKVTVGTFSMYGPDPEGLMQCTMGVECTLELTSTANLASTNQIIITAATDTCGQASLHPASFAGLANPAPVGDANHQFPLGSATYGVPGDYRVCWAHEPTGGHAEFIVDVGTFRMNGPKPMAKKCYLSEPCHVGAAGVGMSPFSGVIFIAETDTCGQAGANVISWSGIVNPSAKLGGETYTGAGIARYYDAGIGAAGLPGDYKVCWGVNPGAQGSEAYNVVIGTFTMAGPYQGAFFTCTLGTPCNLEITGFGLSGSNSLQLASGTCGLSAVPVTMKGINNPRLVTDDATDTLYPMGLVTSGGSYGPCRSPSPPADCIGTSYRLCWSHGVTPLNGALNHLVDIGTFGISGPYGDFAVECFVAQICAFSLYGSELRSSNRVLLVEKHVACGDPSAEAVKLPGLRNPMQASDVVGSSATFRLGRLTGGQVAEYRLCWGGNPRVPMHYNVEIGPFHLRETPDGCEVRDGGLTLSCALE